MINDREYPATHSMSTAWYVVDDEGNVGIIDYNENGPVPWGVEQTCIEELMSGHDEGSNMNNYIRFNLSERQILDMFKKPIKPEEEKLWYLCAVRIDKKKRNVFWNCARTMISANTITFVIRRIWDCMILMLSIVYMIKTAMMRLYTEL